MQFCDALLPPYLLKVFQLIFFWFILRLLEKFHNRLWNNCRYPGVRWVENCITKLRSGIAELIISQVFILQFLKSVNQLQHDISSLCLEEEYQQNISITYDFSQIHFHLLLKMK